MTVYSVSVYTIHRDENWLHCSQYAISKMAQFVSKCVLRVHLQVYFNRKEIQFLRTKIIKIISQGNGRGTTLRNFIHIVFSVASVDSFLY